MIRLGTGECKVHAHVANSAWSDERHEMVGMAHGRSSGHVNVSRAGLRLPTHLLLLVFATLLMVVCGRSEENDATSQPTSVPNGSSPPTVTSGISLQQPTGGQTRVIPTVTSVPPTPLPVFQPNELGQIPILMYHQVGPVPDQFTRTPDQLLADLQWLYDNSFHVISMNDYLTNEIDIHAGKRPVVLTFDDSSTSQFRLLPIGNNQMAIDPNCALGILEKFYAAHPDFGRGAHFALNSDRMFAWALDADESDQEPYIQKKLRWLLDNGYELGNHTVDHANLAEMDEKDVKYQLAANQDAILALVPDAQMNVITLPYGMYPSVGGDKLLRGFEYKGRKYAWDAALLVGANPASSPISTAFSPFETARIQAYDDELHSWFETFLDAPDILYVSDGNVDTTTVPRTLHPWLVGTLDESKLGGKQLVRN